MHHSKPVGIHFILGQQITIYDKKKEKKRQMDMFISTDKKIDSRTLPINPAQIMFDWVDKLKLTVLNSAW